MSGWGAIAVIAFLSWGGVATAGECEGNACRYASIQWDSASGKLRARNNHLNRWIKFETKNPRGKVSLVVGPKSSGLLPPGTFDGAYRADFAK